MISAIITVAAFIAALVMLPRFVLGGRGRRGGRIKVRYGPSRIGRFTAWAGGLFLRYWMYTFPVTAVAIITMIGFMLI